MADEKNTAPKRKRTYEENLELAKARVSAKKEARKTAQEPQAQAMLPWWEEGARRAPNLLLRNALFGISKDRESYGEMRLLASLEGHTVKSNEQLNQYDLDNLEMLLHMQREHAIGVRVLFSGHSFLKAMGRSKGGGDHKQLHDDLTRLVRATVEIRWLNERKSYTESLVASFGRDEKTEMYSVRFSEEMLQLYEAGSAQFCWEQRKKLGKNNLAKWLQVFYASHDAPFPMKAQTLREQSGATSKIGEFRRMLRTALAKLQAVGFLSSWAISEDDLVTVKKTPRPASKKKQKAVAHAV